MEAVSNPSNINREGEPKRTQSVPMDMVGGNSSIEEAQVVFLGTNNHYDPTFQGRIARTLQILPERGDVVLSEGESFGGQLSGSWVPEMARVNTKEVTLTGWENTGLYERATGLVREVTHNIQILNSLSGMRLSNLAKPFIDGLKRKIDTGMANMDKVVLHERSRAMTRSVMSVLGNRLKEGGTVFVYAGSAHLTRSELGGMSSVKHVVLGA